jgi:hypothetical protein
MSSVLKKIGTKPLERLDQILNIVDKFHCDGHATSAPKLIWKANKGPIDVNNLDEIRSFTKESKVGIGSQTVFNPNVRKSRESTEIEFAEEWSELSEILKQIANVMDLNVQLEARIGKLLLYESGSFFRAHRDSEHVQGHLLSFVIDLASDCVGGVVQFGSSPYEESPGWASRPLDWAAWFATAWHSVTKVTKGHRIVLTFDIVAHAPLNPTASLIPSSTGHAGVEPFPALVWSTIADLLSRHDRLQLASTCHAMRKLVGKSSAAMVSELLASIEGTLTHALRAEKLFRVGIHCNHTYLVRKADPNTNLPLWKLKGRDRVVAEAMRQRGWKVSVHKAFVNTETLLDDDGEYGGQLRRIRIGIATVEGDSDERRADVERRAIESMPGVHESHASKVCETENETDDYGAMWVVPWPGVFWLEQISTVTTTRSRCVHGAELYGNDAKFELDAYESCVVLAELFDEAELTTVHPGADLIHRGRSW